MARCGTGAAVSEPECRPGALTRPGATPGPETTEALPSRGVLEPAFNAEFRRASIVAGGAWHHQAMSRHSAALWGIDFAVTDRSGRSTHTCSCLKGQASPFLQMPCEKKTQGGWDMPRIACSRSKALSSVAE